MLDPAASSHVLPVRTRPDRGRPARVPDPPAPESAAQDPACPGRSDPDWRRVLAGATPGTVLTRLVDGDPLDLRAHVAQGLRRRLLLLDAERVFLRTAARVASSAERYRGQPALDAWLDERVEQAFDELLREDRRLATHSDLNDLRPACADLARPLGIEPRAADRILLAFNARPRADRRAFLELVVSGRCFDSLGVRAVAVARRARATLLALLEAERSPLTQTRAANGAPVVERGRAS